jgi:hypothetical protein
MPIVQQPTYTIAQGEDELILIPIILDNQPVDLTTCTNILAIIRTGNNLPEIQFALNASSGTNTLEIDATQTNLIKLPLKREDTKTLMPGALICDLVLETQSLAFPAGKHKELTYIRLGMLREGKLKDKAV